MTEITDDEYTVLMIAAQGECMIPIGRWEVSIKNLHARGLMRKIDDVNYVITQAGRDAAEQREHGDDNLLRDVFKQAGNVSAARNDAAAQIEQAAKHLAEAARLSAKATGATPESAVHSWVNPLASRAIELLQGVTIEHG